MSNIASFRLENYQFKQFSLDFEELPDEIDVDFLPNGIFKPKDGSYELHLVFNAFHDDSRDKLFINIHCVATYKFQDVNKVEDIPPFFYRNAIAIIFPYLRSAVSILSLQANIRPLVIPTYNLSNLEEPLRNNTITE